jgi:hypothetical protein
MDLNKLDVQETNLDLSDEKRRDTEEMRIVIVVIMAMLNPYQFLSVQPIFM